MAKKVIQFWAPTLGGTTYRISTSLESSWGSQRVVVWVDDNQVLPIKGFWGQFKYQIGSAWFTLGVFNDSLHVFIDKKELPECSQTHYEQLKQKENPAYNNAVSSFPPPLPPQTQHVIQREVISKEKVVERQVLVVHCKYCGSVTPADAQNCSNCGGTKFW